VPQRTNDFQELVAMIRRAFARPGDVVTESAMVPGGCDQGEREIDILHQTSDGLVTIKIAIETKDEKRPMSVTAFESYCAKYRGECRVCMDKFVLVSRNGFTKSVRKRAAEMDVPLMTLDEATSFDWARLRPDQTAIALAKQLRLRVPPQVVRVLVKPSLPSEVESTIVRFGRMRCPNRGDHGHLLCYVRHATIWRKDAVGRKLYADIREGCQKHPEGVFAELQLDMTAGWTVHHDGKEYPVQAIGITIRAADSSSPVKLTPYKLTLPDGPRLVHELSADVGNTRFKFLIPDGFKSKQIAFRMGPVNRKQRKRQQKVQATAKKGDKEG
jgi:hypothetical protein